MEKEYVSLHGERDPETETYTLKGLPHRGDFRAASEYETLEASWLKVSGVAFSAPAFELGENETLIVVEQKTDGGGAKIRFKEL